MNWDEKPSDKGRVPEQGVEELKEDSPKKTKKGKGGGISGKAKLIIGLVLVGFLGYVFFGDGDGDFSFANIKDVFTSTPDENMMMLFTGMRDLEEVNKNSGYVDEVYDKGNIYIDEAVFKQVDKEYFLYVYTGIDTNESEFNQWVVDNQDNYPVYKLYGRELMDERLQVLRSGEERPIIYLIKEVDKGVKEVHTYVEEVSELGELTQEIDKLRGG